MNPTIESNIRAIISSFTVAKALEILKDWTLGVKFEYSDKCAYNYGSFADMVYLRFNMLLGRKDEVRNGIYGRLTLYGGRGACIWMRIEDNPFTKLGMEFSQNHIRYMAKRFAKLDKVTGRLDINEEGLRKYLTLKVAVRFSYPRDYNCFHVYRIISTDPKAFTKSQSELLVKLNQRKERIEKSISETYLAITKAESLMQDLNTSKINLGNSIKYIEMRQRLTQKLESKSK